MFRASMKKDKSRNVRLSIDLSSGKLAYKETSFHLSPEEGLSKRPAAEFARKAREFESNITVSYDGKEADAKSGLKVMRIGALQGDPIKITASGSDEDEALRALTEMVALKEDLPYLSVMNDEIPSHSSLTTAINDSKEHDSFIEYLKGNV